MKKKWWIIVAATIAGCIGLAFVIPALCPARPGVTKENFDRIESGMSYDEVVAILGEEPFIIAGGVWHTWENDSGDEIDIELGDDKRVKTKRLEEWPDDRPVFEKLMDGLPWRERPVRHRTRFIY